MVHFSFTLARRSALAQPGIEEDVVLHPLLLRKKAYKQLTNTHKHTKYTPPPPPHTEQQNAKTREVVRHPLYGPSILNTFPTPPTLLFKVMLTPLHNLISGRRNVFCVADSDYNQLETILSPIVTRKGVIFKPLDCFKRL